MNQTTFGEKVNYKSVMCLGAFDSIHLGHREVIKRANEVKLRYGANCAVFTYYNDISIFSNKAKGLVYTFDERLFCLEKIQVDEVCGCEFTEEFAKLSPYQFLNKIADNRPIAAFVCGKDFTFGYNKSGDVCLLSEYCKKKNIDLYVCDFLTDESGNKLSTTTIKNLLLKGEIERANLLLGGKYFIRGEVVRGRQEGRKLGFPTANIKLECGKLIIKAGVYATTVNVGGTSYRAITNVGSAPTFNSKEFLVECYIYGFSGNLYGKILTVQFDGFIREIKKFHSVDLLVDQLNEDLKVIK